MSMMVVGTKVHFNWQLNQINKIISTPEQISIEEIHAAIIDGWLHPNPIGQRMPTINGIDNVKNKGIIEAILKGNGIGTITVRDISNDKEMQKIYPDVKWLVIDGGHRTRAIKDYMLNRFSVFGKKYKELSDEWQEYFKSSLINIDRKICTSQQAIDIFRDLNKTTQVNGYELIMCDDESLICKYVRSYVRSVEEYKNTPHKIFALKDSSKGIIGEHFQDSPDKRALWATMMFIVIHKVLGKGNVSAGEKETLKLIEEEYAGNNKLTKSAQSVVDRFWDDLLRFQIVRPGNIPLKLFGAFQLVWFHLYEQNPRFKIDEMQYFVIKFMQVYKTYNKQSNNEYFEDERKYVWDNLDAFSKEEEQRKIAAQLIEDMGEPEEFGVLFRAKKRNLTKREKEDKLIDQGYRCFFDIHTDKCPQQGKLLTLDESIGAHDIPDSQGGNPEDAVVSCETCNNLQGQMTNKEFISYLNNKQAA